MIETNKIELSKGVVVSVKKQLSWGDTQKIQSVMLSGAKMSGKSANDVGFDFDASTMLEAKYIALECAVIEIEEDGKKTPFTRDWMNNLSQDDGDKVMEAVDGLQKKEQGTPSN